MPTARTRVKICGITNVEDAQAACDYGADALGFIFVPDTPRYVGNWVELPRLLRDLPPFVSRVGVRLEKGDYDERIEKRLDAVQYYRNTAGTVLSGGRRRKTVLPGGRGGRLIHAFRIRDAASLDALTDCDPDAQAVLLDAYHEKQMGGSGEAFDWGLAVEAKRRVDRPIILAGGLTPENVGEAVVRVRPFAVDVSSGVEAEPGRKDHDKLGRFIQAVREADLSP